MLNKFPLWKNLLILLVVLLAALYSAPNLYPDDPAVQISHETEPVTEFELGSVTDALRAAGIEYFGDVIDDRSGLVRFQNLSDQLLGKSVIEETLGSGYFTALNLAPTTPGWMQAINAGKMSLGLDLQGGVHFLMEVDMDAALPPEITHQSRVEDPEVKPELVAHLLAPLHLQARRADDQDAPCAMPQDQFLCDEAGFDGLAQPDVISDQQVDARHLQRTHERVQLIVLDVDSAAEWRLETPGISGRGVKVELANRAPLHGMEVRLEGPRVVEPIPRVGQFG
jgi:hypothetical protein